MNLITYLVVVSTCGVLLVIIPLLLLAGNDSRIKPKFSSDCSFTDALQNSNALYILHLSIVLSILPSAVEVGMDIIEQKAVYLSSVHSNERFLFWAAMLAMSIIFLMFRSSDIFPLIYIGEFYCRNILFNCLTTIIGISEIVKDSVLIKCSVFVVTVSTIAQVFGADATFYLYLYEDNAAMGQILETVSRVLLFVSAVVWAFAKFRWLRLIMIRYKTCFIKFGQLSFSEKRYLLVQVPTILFGSMRVFRYTFYTSENEVQKGYWPSQTENSLIVDISAQYLFLAIASRRVIRDLVITNTNTLRLKQTFVRHVSHEIRSPLNVVHAGLDLLVSEIKDADPEAGTVPISRSTVELIYWIFSSSESAIEILNDLLQYEQMDAGIFNLELSWRELGGSLHNKLNWAQLMADRGNITLSIVDSTSASRCNNSNRSGDADIENGGLMEPWLLLQRDAYFHMDVFRIDQVIRNIITNAMKFTSAGGRVQINIMCEMQNHDNRNKIISKFGVDAVGLFRLEVVDTGVGLSVEDQKRIFGEFTQFNKNELQGGGGSGLGLWISKRIVQMHKGTMGAHSAGLGCGTTVYFELPLFSAATAGKQPVLPPLLPSHQPTSQQVFVGDSLIEREHSSVLLNEVFSTPERRKPLPSASPPLTGSAIQVDSSSDKSDDEGPFISRQLHQKPQQRGEAWMPDLKINQVAESPLGNEMDCLHPQQQLQLQQLVSQVLDFGGGKEDDDDVITPVDQPQQMSILVVDDSALNRKVIVKIIESEKTGRLKNARILEADDGTTAVEMLRREMSEGRKIDFVLMDYVMIKMHGPEAATIMRQDIQYTSTIIAVTGNALPDDMARFIASGANLVVTKPLTKMKLMNALEQFIPP